MTTVKLYVSYAANLLAVILMIVQMVRINRMTDETGETKSYFRRFSGMVLVMAFVYLLKSYASMQLGILTPEEFGRLPEEYQIFWYYAAVSAWILAILFSTVFICMWIHFLGWFLYQDKDFIRRSFWAGFTPLIVAAVVTAVCIPLAITSTYGYVVFIVAVVLFFVIRVLYFLLSLKLLQDYKKQNGYLRFFNPWVFFVPVFAGWILSDVFDWGLSALGSTIGIMLLYQSIVAKERYMDESTGFYNTDFIAFLKDLVKKGKYDPCSVMTFKLNSPDEMADFSRLLKKQLPEDCEPILFSDSEIVVLTNVRKKEPLAMVIGDVTESFEVQAGCKLKKKNETTEEFMERVL